MGTRRAPRGRCGGAGRRQPSSGRAAPRRAAPQQLLAWERARRVGFFLRFQSSRRDVRHLLGDILHVPK